jgi:hypothetical protein
MEKKLGEGLWRFARADSSLLARRGPDTDTQGSWGRHSVEANSNYFSRSSVSFFRSAQISKPSFPFQLRLTVLGSEANSRAAA